MELKINATRGHVMEQNNQKYIFHFVEIHESMLGLIPLKYLEGDKTKGSGKRKVRLYL